MSAVAVGLNKVYSFIVIINFKKISTGNTKAVCLFECYCRQNDNYTDIYDGKMANCCQKVRDSKTNLLFMRHFLIAIPCENTIVNK